MQNKHLIGSDGGGGRVQEENRFGDKLRLRVGSDCMLVLHSGPKEPAAVSDWVSSHQKHTNSWNQLAAAVTSLVIKGTCKRCDTNLLMQNDLTFQINTLI